jgi:hypothetical protein
MGEKRQREGERGMDRKREREKSKRRKISKYKIEKQNAALRRECNRGSGETERGMLKDCEKRGRQADRPRERMTV